MMPPTLEAQIHQRITAWKRQLIDLTRRNRLLNYRPTKASTIEVVDEHPATVVSHLLTGRALRFDDAKGSPARQEADDATQGAREVEKSPRDLSRGRPWIAFSPTDSPSHLVDDRLQTPHDAKRLANNLTYLARLAEESIEEQGVNSLFLVAGMLRWIDGDTRNLAPLLLLPVGLSRKSAAAPWELQMRDEEVFLNPALEEKLRVDFDNLKLPQLPETFDELDVDDLFASVEKVVAPLGWEITSDIAVGAFRFQKFLMYRDLERHLATFTAHPVIRGLSSQHHPEESLGDGALPEAVRNADLDEEMAPWNSVQVKDADSSQQRAILAVRTGAHLVIEGPPGTGKSQTITNIIADAMAEGRSVLFVSEKLAALQVVKDRLESVGLGHYLLELHSDRGSKREFVESLSRALDTSHSGNGNHEQDLRRLKQITTELQAYVVALHEPAGALGISPFGAIGQILESPDGLPRVTAEIADPLGVDAISLDHETELLREAGTLLGDLGPPDDHPLRGLGLRDALPSQVRGLEAAIRRAAEAVDELFEAAEAYTTLLGLRFPRTFGDISFALEMEGVGSRAPGAERGVLENPVWDSMPRNASELLEVGPRFQETCGRIEGRLDPGVLEADLSGSLQTFKRELDRGLLRLLVPSYWRLRAHLRGHLHPGYRPGGDAELLKLHEHAEAARSDRVRLAALASEGTSLFGARWRGEDSDFRELREFAEWIVEFRRFVVKEALEEKGIQIAAGGAVDQEALGQAARGLRATHGSARDALDRVLEAGAFSASSELRPDPTRDLARLAARLEGVEASLHQVREFSRLMTVLDEISRGPFAAACRDAIAAGLPARQLADSVRLHFFERFLEKVMEERGVLRSFGTESHEARLVRFQELDRRSLEHARDRAHLALGVLRQDLARGEMAGQLTLVQREARKRSRIRPIRRLISAAPDVVKRIKPCFMMSPLSVAQYLDPSAITFDLVVFDEASQIPPADAVGALIRAEQSVVVGDRKQLPPTNFFGMHVDAEDIEDDEDMATVSDLESILDEMSTVGVPRVRLKWHYRSEHPSLIRFSNEEFYHDEPLLVFPSSVRVRGEVGLRFDFVDNGVYEGRGRNATEALAVARAVIEHVRSTPDLTLGVGTFGVAQQHLILDELDRLRRESPEVEWFFARGGEHKFFVKNLENIQGDDRDVIFLSVTYGPDHDGVVRRNFGPINKEGGWRRLNVLTTRAKRHLRVFSSMRGDQIDVDGISEGAVLLRRYLKYAETGEYEQVRITGEEPDSPFERAVLRELSARGYRTVPQVGEAGYRIDIGIVDPSAPGRFLCGIECDGASYHSAITVRDRDRLRQQVLEDRGWVIHRVWSTDWFQNPVGQMDRLVRLIEATRNQPQGQGAGGPAPAPPDQPGRGTDGPPPTAPRPQNEEPDGNAPEIVRPEVEEIPIAPYLRCDPGTVGTPDEFYTAERRRVERVLLQVVTEEGPIHFTELCRRVSGAWGLKRAGSQIQAKVRRIARGAVKGGSIEEDGEFFLPRGLPAIEPRSRAAFQAYAPELIHGAEVEAAIRLLLKHRAPLLPDEVVVETARLLGFGRTGSKLNALISGARESLVERGEIGVVGGGLRLSRG